MRGFTTGLAVLAALAAAGAALAAGGPFERRGDEPGLGERATAWSAWERFSPADREAFADARVAALHAGLKLTADQERLWPPVEDAIRGLAKVGREQREARRGRSLDSLREDAPGMLRAMADAQTARADALRKLADASQPLYATFDEGQKRRAMVLARPMGPRRGWGGGPGRRPE